MPTPSYIPQVEFEDVRRVVRRDYCTDDQAAVFEALGKYSENEGWRVKLAVLKLANGSVMLIRKYIDIANTDFRDVLYWAETPGASKNGFVGMAALSQSEAQAIEKGDWDQYISWLQRS